MAHAKNHDYHILPPSIWPFLGAASAFIMLFGAVLWMHGSAPYMGLIGLAGVLYTMFGWWSEVVHEGQTGDHTPVVRIGLRYGFIMFIMSEVMFFSAWFWAFFKNALYPMGPMSPLKDGVWPPEGIVTFDPWHLPLINTLILLCSGAAATWAHHALVHDNNNRKDIKNGLLLAIALGADISKRDQVQAAVAKLRAEFGPITVLVNNAGVTDFTPFEQVTDDLEQAPQRDAVAVDRETGRAQGLGQADVRVAELDGGHGP